METYKYQLRRSSRKEICPQCGKKRFVPYVLTEDNETIPNPEWGRCDRESSCGYWMKPDGNTIATETEPKKPLKPMWVKLGTSVETEARYGRNSLRPYAEWLVGFEKSAKAFKEYYILATEAGEAIFLQIDIHGIVRAGKIMLYKDGHRVKDGQPVKWFHKDRRYRKFVHGEALKQCFFGEHLLTLRPCAPVAIVESEKTALLMSAIRPEYVWLATGGSCGLQNGEKTKVLDGRNVTLFPDNGMFVKWRQVAIPKGWAVNEECLPSREGLSDGYDILDLHERWLIDEQRKEQHNDEIR